LEPGLCGGLLVALLVKLVCNAGVSSELPSGKFFGRIIKIIIMQFKLLDTVYRVLYRQHYQSRLSSAAGS
jgi:hypothetical protein